MQDPIECCTRHAGSNWMLQRRCSRASCC